MIITTANYPGLLNWAAERIGLPYFGDDARAIGKVTKDSEILAVVVYNAFSSDNYRKYNDCQMHVAAKKGAKWATREFLYHAFNYPFNCLGCHRVTGIVSVDNIAAQKFDEKIGFVREGLIREGMNGKDAILYGMLKTECKWLEYRAK